MDWDNFTLHIMGDRVSYFHEDLQKMIDSVTEEEKKELGSFIDSVEITWGYFLEKDIENVLSHICSKRRQCFHLADPSHIEKGYLTYQAHNLTNDYVKGPAYAVVLMYIALLNRHAETL